MSFATEDDAEAKIFDPITPMAAVLRSIGAVRGILEALTLAQDSAAKLDGL